MRDIKNESKANFSKSTNSLAAQYDAFCISLHSDGAAGSFHYALQYRSPVETKYYL